MKTNKLLVLILCFGVLLGGVSASAVVEIEDKPGLTQKDKSKCEKFAEWFQVTKKDGTKFSTVEDLPKFCSVSQVTVWVMNILLAFAGAAATILITIGGFRYLTSAGNEEASEKAKKTLFTAVIGLVVIILAGAMVRIVANTLSIGSSKTSTPPSTEQKTVSPFVDEDSPAEGSSDNIPQPDKEGTR